MKWRVQSNDRLLSKTQPFERHPRPAWDLLRTMRQRRLFPDVYACRGLNWSWASTCLGSPQPHIQACRKLANAVRSLRSLSFHLQGNMVIGALATGGSWEKVHLERHDSGVTIRSRCQVMSSDVKCGLQALSVIDSMKRCQTIPDVVLSSSLGGFGSMVPQTFEHELS